MLCVVACARRCTVVAPLAPDEWRTFASRFLFLTPPADSFRCELGELLLDERLQASRRRAPAPS